MPRPTTATSRPPGFIDYKDNVARRLCNGEVHAAALSAAILFAKKTDSAGSHVWRDRVGHTIVRPVVDDDDLQSRIGAQDRLDRWANRRRLVVAREYDGHTRTVVVCGWFGLAANDVDDQHHDLGQHVAR